MEISLAVFPLIVGVTMALLVTAVWCVMLVVSSAIEKKAHKTQQDKISD